MWSGTERLESPVERWNDHFDFTEMKAGEGVKEKAVTVACKYEETRKPTLLQHTEGMRHCTPNQLSPKQLLLIEIKILKSKNFRT